MPKPYAGFFELPERHTMTQFAPSVADYPFSLTIETRAQDCDGQGHINNVVFYSFFDTAVNQFLIEHCELDIQQDKIVPFVSGSQCQYIAHATYPEAITVGMRVIKMGRSAVTYGLTVYAGETERRVAHGQFVHVYVERSTDKAVPIPGKTKDALQALTGELE